MLTEELNYELPAELIAQNPALERAMSRLLVLDRKTGGVVDKTFTDLINYLRAGDCLVLNQTKVLPARFFARRKTGANIEGLFLDEPDKGRWHVMLKNACKLKHGEEIDLMDRNKGQYLSVVAESRLDEGRWILSTGMDRTPEKILADIGFAALPPYIKREYQSSSLQAAEDLERYQTVFAVNSGAVAAPTAGLHFTEELLDEIKQSGVNIAFVTLHVGAGTFKPVSTETLEAHEIHSERYEIDEENTGIINRSIESGGRITAVGTTSVRTLETAAADGKVIASSGDTRLFIMPGYKYKVVEAMVTNFHLPKSTLLALVGAFAGLDNVKHAYCHAIEKRYRFYSYGDAMLII